ncbi:MAG: hypothetical protein ABW360_05010 [Phenylobacterium sp.]
MAGVSLGRCLPSLYSPSIMDLPRSAGDISPPFDHSRSTWGAANHAALHVYPYDCDARSSTFEVHELASEARLSDLALKVLLEHPSCDHVELWQAKRYVLTRGNREDLAISGKPDGLGGD